MIVTGQAAITDVRSDFNTDTGTTTGGATSIVVLNTGADTIYLGGSGVTSATGFPLAAGAGASFDNISVNDLYAVCAAADTSTLAWLYERNA